MRFRLGLVVGFGAGYYLGTKAGPERHEEINRAVARIRRSDAFAAASDKAKAVVDLTVERAKEAVDQRLGHEDQDEAGSGNGMGAGAAPPFPSPGRP